MTEFIQFIGADSGNHIGGDHFQYLGGQLAGNAHFCNFVSGFYDNAHFFFEYEVG
jgi:hypothetical protein